MKNILQLILISILLISSSNIKSQDLFFSQFENAPLNLNPGLTGNFDGKARFFFNYRNQWPSILKDYSPKTGSLSIDSKFVIGIANNIGVGINTVVDRSGSLNYQTNQYNFLSSIIHNFGDGQNADHSISFGIKFSLVNQKIDWENASWPGETDPPELYNSKIRYLNISSGVVWQYHSDSRFSLQLGSSIHNINKPNISFHKLNEHNLTIGFSLHGHSEVPVIRNVSLVASFLFSKQGPFDIIVIGLNSKWYFKPDNFTNFLQIGLYGKSGKDYSGKRSFNTYVLTAMLELNRFSVGFSYDHFLQIDDGAYELSIGYIINKKILNTQNIVSTE
ncbi:MAG: PorP/SprF family type IX secretion system membrane protein [Saprospiraceae bacterium]|nr:PorP/SprF family type IX secretion system membrane protein [Saprospiraceae bacterium]